MLIILPFLIILEEDILQIQNLVMAVPVRKTPQELSNFGNHIAESPLIPSALSARIVLK